MKFTTPCFVRVEDAEKRKELIRWIRDMNMMYCHDPESRIICVCTDRVSALNGFKIGIDCGDNIFIFRALAAMNDENDYMQWFTDGESFELCTGIEYLKEDLIPCDLQERKDFWRKATVTEIVEYFKNKEK